MAVRNPVLAWWFDEAIGWLGRWVDSHLEQVDSKGKRKYSVESVLGIKPAPAKIDIEEARKRGDLIVTGRRDT